MPRKRAPSRQMRRLVAAWMVRPNSWRYGYELMKETGLSSGTLYPILMRMTEEALVEAEWRDSIHRGRPPRHVYRLTKEGVALGKSMASGVNTASGISLALSFMPPGL